MKHLITLILTCFIFTTTAYAADRATYNVSVHGTSRSVPESVISRLCGDNDGCVIRLGMRNYANAGRTASRETLFYYNIANRTWRASLFDRLGTNNNNVTQHVMQVWSCYFTDGAYRGFAERGDFTRNFALLAWRSYPRSSCVLTIID